MTTQTIYVLAESHEAFCRLCKRMGITPFSATYLQDRNDLMGRRISFAVATPAWIENPSYDWRFIDVLKLCCGAVFIEGDLP